MDMEFVKILEQVINDAIKHNASDIHLTHNGIYFRVKKQILPYNIAYSPTLFTTSLENLCKDLGNEQSISIYIGEVRCRISKFETINGDSYAIRIYNNHMPTLDSIQAPLALAKLCENTSGLILVCGTTGAGKSTTLAAMINHINTTARKHILTLEDPIEYIHKSDKSLISQREIGLHSSESSLIASLREDPDVILIGEILSPEVLDLAITHALSGHLVLASFHAHNCMDAITRMIGMKQSDCNIRANLATCLQGIITQKLYDDGERLVADFEILIANAAVSALIKDDKIWQLDSQISMGKSVGMQHFSESKVLLIF